MKASTRVSLVAILKTVQVLAKRIEKLLASETPREATLDQPNKTMQLWHTYSACYHDRWKVEPSRSAQAMSILKSLIASQGYETAELIVNHYFEMKDAWYVKSCHPLTILKRDADRILVDARTGKSLTVHEAAQLDKQVSHGNLLTRIRDGKV